MKADTIVAFHIGRGGKFNNPGHLKYLGEKPIAEFCDDLFPRFENETKFENRFGYDDTHGSDQRCIIDLIADRAFAELEEKFGITEEMLGQEEWFQENGSSTGLSMKDYKSGIGTINLDNEYDTVYTKYYSDCNEHEKQLIRL